MAAPAPVPTQESLGTPGAFDLAKCTRLFAECSAAAHDVPVLPFLTACEEVKKVVASLGVVLGFASVEISDRVAGILARVKDLRQAGAAQGGLAAPQSADAAATAAPAAARASSAAAAGGAGGAGGAPADAAAVSVRETLQWLVEDEAAHKGAAERGASVRRSRARAHARNCAQSLKLRCSCRTRAALPPARSCPLTALATPAAAPPPTPHPPRRYSAAPPAPLFRRPRATSTGSSGCWTSLRAC